MERPWKALFAVLLLALVSRADAQIGQSEVLLGTGLASRLRWVKFEVVGGRIVASSVHVGTNVNSTATSSDGGRRERLSIDLTNAAPNVRYELVDKAHEITLEVTDGEQILIRHVRKEDRGTRSVEYSQAPRQALTLTIEQPDGKRVVSGPTLWHLLLAEPDVTKQLLTPTLEMLKPGWKLATVADAIEESLCQNARLRRTLDRDRWIAWVTDLSSIHYADRQDAERQLLEAGREVLPFLRSFERTTLDAEQWRRVRNVIAALDSEQSDSVEQIVTLLAGDPRAWISMLGRDEESKRRLAVEQLKSITGGPIDFEPTATAEIRQGQLERLRERFAPPAVKSESESE